MTRALADETLQSPGPWWKGVSNVSEICQNLQPPRPGPELTQNLKSENVSNNLGRSCVPGALVDGVSKMFERRLNPRLPGHGPELTSA